MTPSVTPTRPLPAIRPITIHLCHHSHTDIGYTHEQPVVMELHSRFIDQAIDLCEKYADRGEATFRWTCEVTAVVEHFLATRSPKQIERFLAAARRGQIEICVFKYNLAPLAGISRLREMMQPMEMLRTRYGLPIRVAMNSDVNGQSWGVADVLLDHGVETLTMAINEHFGHAPDPRPGLFEWQAPSGRKMRVWNGLCYAYPAWLCIGQDQAIARKNLNGMIAALQADGYTLPTLYMQITHPGPQNDNVGPVPWLSDWVEQFNATNDAIKFVITTPSVYFDLLAKTPGLKATPWRGDWTDWWNFGAASTPIETAINRQSQAKLLDADVLAAAFPEARNPRLRARAAEAIDLWIEHTWGADCSVHRPADWDTRSMWFLKAFPAYEARALTGLLARDGMTALAKRVDGPRPGVVVFNPTGYARRTTIDIAGRMLRAERVPLAPLPNGEEPVGWPADPAFQTLVDRVAWREHEVAEIGPINLPPFGWTVITDADIATPLPGLKVEDAAITADGIALRAGGGVGLSSLKVLGREWVSQGVLPFGAVVLEQITGTRTDIMKFDDSEVPSRTRKPVWNSDVAIRRSIPKDVMTSVTPHTRSATLTQTSTLPTCTGITQRWRVRPDEGTIELTVEIDKAAVIDPHSLYLALPFDLPQGKTLVEVAGAVLEPEKEQVPGSAPWMSLAGGFCIGDAEGTAYVAAPDSSLVQFRRFRIGASAIDGKKVDQLGLALLWLYNNYWETNFVADQSGRLRFRVIFGFTSGAPEPAHLIKFCELAARPPMDHPLPAIEPGSAAASLPSSGQLFSIEGNRLQVVSITALDQGVEVLVNNPTNAAGSVTLREGDFFRKSANGSQEGSVTLTVGPHRYQAVKLGQRG